MIKKRSRITDTKRLDWMEAQRRRAWKAGKLVDVNVDGNRYYGRTFRQAIDRAMKESKP